MTPVVFLIVAGNVVVLLTALFGSGRWFRNWLVKTVSEPIEQLKVTVTSATEIANQAHADSQRANGRLDRHLETHSHA